MNTEPPEGDELQRMLVSMKRNVLDRAAPRPKRRRGRSGLVIGVVALLAVGTATGAVALTLSQQDEPVASPVQTQEPEPAPSATTPTSAPITATPTPRPTPTTAPTGPAEADVRIPGDCFLIVPESDAGRLFGAARLTSQIWLPDGGIRFPDGNDRINGLVDTGESLDCWWSNDGVAQHVSVTIRPAASDDTRAVADTVEDSSPTCVDRLGGRACTWRPGTDSGDDVVGTFFVRGNLSIDISQTDFPTDGLLPAIVGKIWGD